MKRTLYATLITILLLVALVAPAKLHAQAAPPPHHASRTHPRRIAGLPERAQSLRRPLHDSQSR